MNQQRERAAGILNGRLWLVMDAERMLPFSSVVIPCWRLLQEPGAKPLSHAVQFWLERRIEGVRNSP